MRLTLTKFYREKGLFKRNDKKNCNNLFLDTGKTCREIGTLNKQKK